MVGEGEVVTDWLARQEVGWWGELRWIQLHGVGRLGGGWSLCKSPVDVVIEVGLCACWVCESGVVVGAYL